MNTALTVAWILCSPESFVASNGGDLRAERGVHPVSGRQGTRYQVRAVRPHAHRKLQPVSGKRTFERIKNEMNKCLCIWLLTIYCNKTIWKIYRLLCTWLMQMAARIYI